LTPCIDVGCGFGPLKKRSSEILGDRWNFLIFGGKWRIFGGKVLKKVVEKFRQKFGPPVSEVLDPLVPSLDLVET